MRVRNAKRCGGSDGGELAEDKQELDWDNSALTVTVNPMHPDVSSWPAFFCTLFTCEWMNEWMNELYSTYSYVFNLPRLAENTDRKPVYDFLLVIIYDLNCIGIITAIQHRQVEIHPN